MAISPKLDPEQDPRMADFLAQASILINRYGKQPFQQQLTQFSELLSQVNTLNRQYAQLDAYRAQEEDIIPSIVAATQRYYDYMNKQPDEWRHFYLLLTEYAGSRETMDQLQILTNTQITRNIAPLLSIQAIRPQKYIMQVDALTNHLATLDSETKIRVGGPAGHPVLTTVTLDMPDHMRIDGGGSLSIYDKSIINGVTSLIESGNTVFSIPMLYHAMTGKQNPTVDEQLYEELTQKMEKMRRMMLSIDLTEEHEAHYVTSEDGTPLKIEDVQLEGYLLPLNKITGKVNGKRTELYQIIQYPPLYSYSKMKRQLASVKISLLGAPVNNNSTTIPLKTYLLQRVELMRNKHNKMSSSVILYDSIYDELGANDTSKTRKIRIRTYTEIILGHFISENYIRGYTVFKRGRSIAGVNILL